MYAAEYGNSDLVKILLENAADINAQDNNGKLHNINNVSIIYILS